jgi:hypothetical protein
VVLNRFEHAAAPSTSAAIIETGLLTSGPDRALIVDDPDRAARGISMGIRALPGERAGMRPASHERGEWLTDLVVWGNFRVFGRMMLADLRPVSGG